MPIGQKSVFQPSQPRQPAQQPMAQNNGFANINSSITPMNVYDQRQTNASMNQARAAAQRSANPNFAMKQFDRPGVSRSAGSLGAAMPSIMNARANAGYNPANIVLGDAAANANSILTGQVNRDHETQGILSLLGNQQVFDANQRVNNMMPFLGYIGNLLSGGGGGGGGGPLAQIGQLGTVPGFALPGQDARLNIGGMAQLAKQEGGPVFFNPNF